MLNLLTWLSKRRFPYEPLITIEISRSRLLRNFNEFKKLAPSGQIAPVLKSNAYGHGMIEIAKILEDYERGLHSKKISPWKKIPFFVVDSYFEAIALRAKNVKTPILVIGYTRPETIAKARLKDVSFVVTNIETLRAFKIPARIMSDDSEYISEPKGLMRMSSSFLKRYHRIHLKIDTGMRRQGIMPEEIPEAIQIIKDNHSLILEGLCSHFSDADNTDGTFTERQISIWNKAVHAFKAVFPKIRYLHLSNTDGHRFYNDIEADVSRLGIGLYGISENVALNEELCILPVMEMKTILTGVKHLKKGETVGYSNTFKALNDMTIATIPVGYFEGLDRRLSNKGFIQVGPDHILCPIIGKVSMNITVIDISRVEAIHAVNGTVVTVISSDPAAPNSIASMARDCGIISYELAVKIPAHLKRVIVD